VTTSDRSPIVIFPAGESLAHGSESNDHESLVGVGSHAFEPPHPERSSLRVHRHRRHSWWHFVTAVDRRAASPDLARLAATGDEAAFRHLVDVYHGDVLGLCYAITRDPDLAAEAAQRAWVKAWLRLATLREPEKIHAWLCAIAANEARAVVGKRRRVTIVPLDVAVELGHDQREFTSATSDVDLERALSRLSPEDRALLGLRYVAGLNSNELAASLHLTPSGTRARLGRLLKRLREELNDG
jgi:RNA polymerase sigma-70 factor (ECF subfamily)